MPSKVPGHERFQYGIYTYVLILVSLTHVFTVTEASDKPPEFGNTDKLCFTALVTIF